MKIGCIATLAILCCGSAAMGQDTASSPTEGPPVNLAGVAVLSFDSSPENHPHWERFTGSFGVDFVLEIEEDGALAACGPARPDIADDLIELLCTDLLDHARVKLPVGFRLGGRKGLVGMRMEPYMVIPGVSDDKASPFTFRVANLDEGSHRDYALPLKAEQPIVPPESGVFKPLAEAIRYPELALERRMEGVSRVLVGISPKGKPATCRPVQSSGSAILDNMTCVQILAHRDGATSNVATREEPDRYSVIAIRWQLSK